LAIPDLDLIKQAKQVTQPYQPCDNLQLRASCNILRLVRESTIILVNHKMTVPLGAAPVGMAGTIRAVRVEGDEHGLSAAELERRLIELGFVEGARVQIVHEGWFGRDPIAIRVNDATIALRRREAGWIFVEPEPR
jgi:ferrous iron transport protein A